MSDSWWLRGNPAMVVDLAASTGAATVGIADAGTLYTATDVEAALAEVKTIADAGVGAVKRTVTITHADLTDAVAGEAQAIDLGAILPTNANVFAHSLVLATPFSGGSVSSCLVDVGGTDADAIVNALECITDQPTEAEVNAAGGIKPQGAYSAQQLVVTFTPDGGHALLALTAGSITLTVWYFVLA